MRQAQDALIAEIQAEIEGIFFLFDFILRCAHRGRPLAVIHCRFL